MLSLLLTPKRSAGSLSGRSSVTRIDTKAGHFDPKKFEDHYDTALAEMLRKKQKGKRSSLFRRKVPLLNA